MTDLDTDVRDAALCALAVLYLGSAAWLSHAEDPVLTVPLAILGCLPLLVAATRAVDARVGRRWTAVLRACWPVVAAPTAYLAEVRIVELERQRYFDGSLALLDRTLGLYRGTDPVWSLGGRLEEAANLLYASYYLIPVIVLVLAVRTGPREAARATTALALASLSCGFIWLVLPSGGYFLAGSPQGPSAGPFSWLVHRLYANYPHYAAAFPSEHVAHAVALAVVLKSRSRWFLAWAAGIALATVLGQYHYGIDPIAGAIIGWGCGAVAARRAVVSTVSHRVLALPTLSTRATDSGPPAAEQRARQGR